MNVLRCYLDDNVRLYKLKIESEEHKFIKMNATFM